MSKWIDINERLPSTKIDDDGNCPMVLVVWKRASRDESLGVIDVSNTLYLQKNKDDATHWMPLPDLP